MSRKWPVPRATITFPSGSWVTLAGKDAVDRFYTDLVTSSDLLKIRIVASRVVPRKRGKR